MASIQDLLAKQNNKAGKTEKKTEHEFVVQQIHYTKLIENEDNFYSTKDVEALADSIVLAGGIKQPLLVIREEPGTYKIIAGHRRYKAARLNIERGYSQYEFIPCKIEDTDELQTEFNLIITNSTQRDRSEFEKMKEVQKLKEIIPKLIGDETIKGRALRAMVAEGLNVSETKVANYDNITNNLAPEGMKKFAEGELTVSAANELAGLDQKEQKKLLEEKEIVSYSDVKQKKEELETPKEIVAVVKLLGRKDEIKDILRYTHGSEEKIKELKSLLAWKADESYCFFIDGVTVKATVEGQKQEKTYLWKELIQIWTKAINEISEQYDRLSPKETEFVIRATKEQLVKSSDDGDITKFVNTYTGYADADSKIALLKEYLIKNIYKVYVDGHSVHFKDYRISFTRAGDKVPVKVIKYEDFCKIIDAAISSGEISKTVSDSDTEKAAADSENTSGLEDYECENQMPIEEYVEEQAAEQESERLVLKNNQEREDFINSWKDWSLWFESPQIEAKYYRYVFDDGSYIVAVSYKHSSWSRYMADKEEYSRANMHLVKVGENYYGEYATSMTDMIEHIKKVVPRK